MEIGTEYVKFGTFLLDDINGSRVKIMARKHHYNAEEINTEILQKWLTGSGKQPVTWATLVEVLQDIELSTLADQIKAVKCPQVQSQDTEVNQFFVLAMSQKSGFVCPRCEVCMCNCYKILSTP